MGVGRWRFHDIGFENDFLDMTPKAQEKNKQKQANGTTSNLKPLCNKGKSAKKMENVPMEPMEWEKTLKIINKGIISRINKKQLKFKNKSLIK